MRANEFLNEANKKGQVRKSLKQSGPFAKRYDQLDTFYDMYRLGIALANDEAPSIGVTSNSPTVWVRNDEEANMLTNAERAMGIKGTVVVPNGKSSEMKDVVNITSPVAAPKRNKYGV
jgi:hypothetical protein